MLLRSSSGSTRHHRTGASTGHQGLGPHNWPSVGLDLQQATRRLPDVRSSADPVVLVDRPLSRSRDANRTMLSDSRRSAAPSNEQEARQSLPSTQGRWCVDRLRPPALQEPCPWTRPWKPPSVPAKRVQVRSITAHHAWRRLLPTQRTGAESMTAVGDIVGRSEKTPESGLSAKARRQETNR